MTIDTAACNEALGHLAIGIELSDVSTDTTLQGRTCRAFYPIALKFVTRAYDWPKHGEIGALAEVECESRKWERAYRQPSNCVRFRRIDNGCAIQTPENQIPYDTARDSQGPIILTNEAEAIGEWSVIVENAEEWDADFRMAFTRYLAFLMAPKLTGGDQFKLGPLNYQLFKQTISEAAARAFNESQKPYDNSSGYSRARR